MSQTLVQDIDDLAHKVRDIDMLSVVGCTMIEHENVLAYLVPDDCPVSCVSDTFLWSDVLWGGPLLVLLSISSCGCTIDVGVQSLHPKMPPGVQTKQNTPEYTLV